MVVREQLSGVVRRGGDDVKSKQAEDPRKPRSGFVVVVGVVVVDGVAAHATPHYPIQIIYKALDISTRDP